MKFFTAIFKWKLRLAAKWVLDVQKPTIIAVTGSVGKTTARVAVEAVVRKKYRANRTYANFNNEFGMPLTVLGVPSGIGRIGMPLVVLFYFFKALLSKTYPQVLVLEMGADRPGDIVYLTKIAKPHVAIITRVGHSHTEYLGDLNSIQKEKAELIKALPKDGVAVLNEDDPRVLAMKNLHKGKVLTYGFSESANIRAENYSILPVSLETVVGSDTEYGMHLSIEARGKRHKIEIHGVIGRPAAYACLAAFAAGSAMEISTEDILEALTDLAPQPGRLKIIAGIKHTALIDDTYNSSPESSAEALRLLKQIRGKRKIAVLGDMLELGPATEKAHRMIGKLAADLQIDLLYVVGARSKFTATEAREAGIAKTKVREFENTVEAGLELQNKLREGDAVLIKGSQGMRMEKIVEEVMAEPEKAGDLLCRQSRSWKKKQVARV